MTNSILDSENDVAARIAQRTLAKREAGYASEVRRLLDAALEVMRQGGTAARPRVADIVHSIFVHYDHDEPAEGVTQAPE